MVPALGRTSTLICQANGSVSIFQLEFLLEEIISKLTR